MVTFTITGTVIARLQHKILQLAFATLGANLHLETPSTHACEADTVERGGTGADLLCPSHVAATAVERTTEPLRISKRVCGGGKF